jgi:hypothetical protein
MQSFFSGSMQVSIDYLIIYFTIKVATITHNSCKGTLPGFCFLEEEVIKSLTFLSGTALEVDLLGCLLVFVLTCSTVAFLAGPFFSCRHPSIKKNSCPQLACIQE